MSISVRLGAYAATLSGFVVNDFDGNLRMDSPSVTLSYDGKATSTYQLLDEPGSWYDGGLGFTTKTWSPPGSIPGSVLCLARFDRNPDVQVLVPLFEPGQCCTFDNLFEIYDFANSGSSDAIGTANLGEVGGTLVDEHGVALLLGIDPRFTGAFSDYVGTSWPLRVYTLDDLGLIDVTRQWPSLIERDAGSDLERFDQLLRHGKPQDTRGLLAAWAADECELGRCSQALTFVSQKLAAGDAAPFEGSATAYLALLRHDLMAWGYVSGKG